MYFCFQYKMAPKQPNTGLFVGLNKGHVVTKKELAPRPSDRKGKQVRDHTLCETLSERLLDSLLMRRELQTF